MTASDAADRRQGGATVLLAEDDPDVSDLVRHVLQADGYHVERGRDGDRR